MKVFIITDLEGPAMVSRFAQTRDYREAPDLKVQAMQLLTAEVNATVDGVLDAYPRAEIIVWDGHGSGGIDVLSFHPRARLIAGAGIRPPYGLDATFDALFFTGQHAMAGTPNAPLCHTYSSKTIEYYKINGQFTGEFGARAIMAGTTGVPSVFVSGDDKAVAEAKRLVPRIHAATVKWGLGLELALHLSPQAARECIRRVACEAAQDVANIPPVIVEPPYTQEIRVQEGVSIERYVQRGAEALDDRTVVLRSDNICDLYV